jgi:hypothetical protein
MAAFNDANCCTEPSPAVTSQHEAERMAILKRGEGLTRKGFARAPYLVRVLMPGSGVGPSESWRRGEGPGLISKAAAEPVQYRRDFGKCSNQQSLRDGSKPKKLGQWKFHMSRRNNLTISD